MPKKTTNDILERKGSKYCPIKRGIPNPIINNNISKVKICIKQIKLFLS